MSELPSGLVATFTSTSAYPTEKLSTEAVASTPNNVFLALSVLEAAKLRFDHHLALLRSLLTNPAFAETLQVITGFFNILVKIYIAYLTALNKVYPCEKSIFEGISNVFRYLFPQRDLEIMLGSRSIIPSEPRTFSAPFTSPTPTPFDPAQYLQSLLQVLYDTLIYLFAITDNLPDDCQKCYFYSIIFSESQYFLPAILNRLRDQDSALADSIAAFIVKVEKQLKCLPNGKAKCKVYSAIINLLQYLLNVVIFYGPISIFGVTPIIIDPEELGRLICRIVKYLPCHCRDRVDAPVVRKLSE